MVAVRRIAVEGTSGSGKSTLAERISRRLGIAHIQLDAIHHQENWTPMPVAEFRAAVAERIAADAWVVDGNYHSKLGDLVWERVDAVLWFDLPRARVMWQIIRRTAGRIVTGRELWNGNREQWRNFFSLNPERSVIVWAWRTHAGNRARFLAARSDPAYGHIEFIRLRSHREADAVLAELALRAKLPE
ncbi:hypothetical protein [Nocardia terpenica]|uniref:Adenylate kinase n=1 Tax=Nocardia terpenica TaxID=455432 RepID=A0A164JQT6_9NOCA|nr:hypothetical protein [Nocardia terpenica]KZM70639.1 hypothetical protein AWN90_39400 [Nocardia terpenica]NQE90105.1 adenylate kinase [Nocardia terpenica]